MASSCLVASQFHRKSCSPRREHVVDSPLSRYSQSRSAGSVGVQPVQTMTSTSYGSTTIFPATSTGRYDPYAPPRVPPPPVSAAPVPGVSKPRKISHGLYSAFSERVSVMRFKSSPFFRIDQSVSGIAECPGLVHGLYDFRSTDHRIESTSSTDRKQQSLTFTLNSEQTVKLNSTRYADDCA